MCHRGERWRLAAIDDAADDDVLVMTDVRKRYGDTIALDGASLRVSLADRSTG